MLDWRCSVYSFCSWLAHENIWFQDIPSACQLNRGFDMVKQKLDIWEKELFWNNFHMKAFCSIETVLGDVFPWQQRTGIVNFLGLFRFSNVCENVFHQNSFLKNSLFCLKTHLSRSQEHLPSHGWPRRVFVGFCTWAAHTQGLYPPELCGHSPCLWEAQILEMADPGLNLSLASYNMSQWALAAWQTRPRT